VYVTTWIVPKRSSPEVSYLGDLLERLLQGCTRHRSFDNSSQVAAASLVMSQTCLSRVLGQVSSTLGVDALNRDLYIVPHWLRPVDFTSKDDQFETGQTQEGIQKTELSSGLGEPLL